MIQNFLVWLIGPELLFYLVAGVVVCVVVRAIWIYGTVCE